MAGHTPGLLAAAPDLLNALVLALPYVEAAESDEGYKPGAVRGMVNIMKSAIEKAESQPAPILSVTTHVLIARENELWMQDYEKRLTLS